MIFVVLDLMTLLTLQGFLSRQVLTINDNVAMTKPSDDSSAGIKPGGDFNARLLVLGTG